jgi:hypothetical protein
MPRFPGAAHHVVVRCRPGIHVPDQRRTAPRKSAAHCAASGKVRPGYSAEALALCCRLGIPIARSILRLRSSQPSKRNALCRRDQRPSSTDCRAQEKVHSGLYPSVRRRSAHVRGGIRFDSRGSRPGALTETVAPGLEGCADRKDEPRMAGFVWRARTVERAQHSLRVPGCGAAP